jgi:hypothetical protein
MNKKEGGFLVVEAYVRLGDRQFMQVYSYSSLTPSVNYQEAW